MSSNKTTSVSLSTILLVVFVTLKLTGLIDWSWVWVLAPLWIPLGFLFITLIVIAVCHNATK